MSPPLPPPLALQEKQQQKPQVPSTGDRLINEAIKRILLDIVIRGHGDRLIGRWSREPELQQFLEQVPYMLDRINQLHLACCRQESQDFEHSHHYHHHHQRLPCDSKTSSCAYNQENGALDDFISLVGEDRHWLVRTRDTLGLTPLHKAVLFHNRPIVEYIVDRYQDELAASSVWRATESHRARYGFKQVQGQQAPQATTRLLDAQDKYGRTALHYAAALLSQRSTADTVKQNAQKLATINHLYHFLVAKGASLSVQDFRGKTPPHYVRHPNQLRSKSIIHLANKLNANYQANVLTKTLRASDSRAPIETATSYDGSQLPVRATTTELHRESMSTSCNDLRRSSGAVYGDDNDRLIGLDRKRSQSTVITSDEAELENMMLVYNGKSETTNTVEKEKQDKRQIADTQQQQQQSITPNSISSNQSPLSDTSMDLTDVSSECRRQLIADRCPGVILDQRTKLSIRRCLNDGVIDRINELLLAGHGSYLVREAAVSCWNLQCKRYISQVIPSLLAQVDQLHEFIASNQLLAVKSLLSIDPILARIRRPYKRAAINALHLAAQKNRSTIAKYLVQKFPELLNQQDSNGATCLHLAAKSCVDSDRLYRWLSDHYGSQLQPVRDFRNKTALDYRQQALRMSEYAESRPTVAPQKPKEARELIQKVQDESNKLQLSGTKIHMNNKRKPSIKSSVSESKSEINRTSSELLEDPTVQIGIESPSTGPGSRQSPIDNHLPVIGQNARRASSSAQPFRSEPIANAIRRLSESNSSKAATQMSNNLAQEKTKLVNSNVKPERFRFNELEELVGNDGSTQSDDQARAKLLNELVQLDSNEFDISKSSGSAGDSAATSLASPLATPSLPLSRPHSASKSSRLTSMIKKSIELEDFQRLEHLILAGCGSRLLSVYKQLPKEKLDLMSARMRHFLNNYTPEHIDKIATIHQVLHKCYSIVPDINEVDEESESNPSSAFHKLCNLLNRNRLIMCRDPYGATPLHIALLRADDKLIEYLLRRHPEAASAPDNEKRNSIHYAALVLAAYNQHGEFKLTVDESKLDEHQQKSTAIGYWRVGENAATIYENICSRYGELLRVKDRKGFTATEYLDKSYEHSETHLCKPLDFSACCPDYSELLLRYNYVVIVEDEQVLENENLSSSSSSSSSDTPDLNEPSVRTSVDARQTIRAAELTQSIAAQQVPSVASNTIAGVQTNVKQVVHRPTGGNASILLSSSRPLVALPEDDIAATSIKLQRVSPSDSSGKRHHKHKSRALLDDLDPNHRAHHHRHHRRNHHHHHRHHSARKSPTGVATRQSLVGGVIVPTIIHNDKMDEIETYDIIYRQPPASSSGHLSSSSNSSSFSSCSENEDLDATLKPRTTSRQSKVKETVKLDKNRVTISSSSSSSSSELDDEDERVERLSNEFEIRVRREKNELRAKVDQIMNEIKMSAKSGKSSRFLASPIQPPSNESNDEQDRSKNTVMFLNGFTTNTSTKSSENNIQQQQASLNQVSQVQQQQPACSLSSSGHSSCSSASSLGSTCSQSVTCSSSASRTANSSSTYSTPTSSTRTQPVVTGTRIPQNELSSAKPVPNTNQLSNVFGAALSRVAGQAIEDLNNNQVISKNTYGQTYLHFIASRSQSSSTLYKVLEHGRHMVGERDIFYRTARDVALQFNLANNVQVLDKFIIDQFVGGSTVLLNHLLNQGYSPLIHVSDPDGNDIMLILKLLKLERMIHFLLQMADFQRWRDELHTFIRNGYSAGVTELIRKHPNLVKAKSTHSRTSLHLAVLFDRPNMVKELLEADSSSVYSTDNMGRTALHYTYGLNLKNVEEIRDLLLSNGASLETRDVKMRTPKYYYIFKREIEEIKRMELELN